MIESPKNLKTLTERVTTTFPGIEIFVLDRFNGINSFKAMKKQHDVFKADLKSQETLNNDKKSKVHVPL